MIRIVIFISMIALFIATPPDEFYEVLYCVPGASYFICITGVRDIIVWDIWRGLSNVYTSSYHQYDVIGEKYNKSIGSIHISSEMISVNSTHITSTLMVFNSLLSGYSISCNNVMKELRGFSLEANILPESLKIVPNGDDDTSLNFTAMWNYSVSDIEVQYFISIYSREPNHLDVQAVNKTSVSFSLNLNTEYLINISVCSNSTYESGFTFGRCPFIGTVPNVILNYYLIDMTGATVAMLWDASSNQSLALECDINGKWNWKSLTSFFITTKTGNSDSTETVIGEKITNCSISTTEKNGIQYSIMASIAFATFILGIFVGVVGAISTILIKKHFQSYQSHHRNVPIYETVTSAVPKYETVTSTVPKYEIVTSVVKVPVSQNLAYAQVPKLLL